ncbi:MAG: hypothetical protein AAFP92_31545 [Bacteroidota bacterium]
MKAQYFILWLLLLLACQPVADPNVPPIQVLEPVHHLSSFSDTLYAGWLRWMTASEDHIFISDHHEDHVIMLDHDLNLVKVLGREGRGPGEFNGPAFSAVGQGQLWIDDPGNIRFQVFSLDGEFLKTVPINHIEDQILTLGTFTVDHEDFIWLSSDKGEKPLVRMNQEGKVMARYAVQPPRREGYSHTAHLLTTSQNHLISLRIMDGLLEKLDLNGQLIEEIDLSALPGMDSSFAAIDTYLKTQQVDFIKTTAELFHPVSIHRDQVYVFVVQTNREMFFTPQEGSRNDLYVFDVYPHLHLTHHYKLRMPFEEAEDGENVECASVFTEAGKTFLFAASASSEFLYLYELPQPLPSSK